MKRGLEETEKIKLPVLKIHKKDEKAVLPSKEHESDAGLDVTIVSVFKKYSELVTLYSTGITLEPEVGYHTELIARSSLMKKGYMLTNSVGIIDNTYRGLLLVALYKFDPDAPDIELPARVAQLIPRKTVQMKVVEVKEVSETERGEGGFGSTDMYKSYEYGIFIKKTCLESYPCSHHVNIKGADRGLMDGPDIVKEYINSGCKEENIPEHFKQYINWKPIKIPE